VLSVGVAGAPGEYVQSADVTPVDFNGDGLFDLLNVSVGVVAPADGSYTVRVTLAWPEPATPAPITSRTETFVLDTTARHVVVALEGPRIRDVGLDGPYEVQVHLSSSAAGGVSDDATFLTPALEASDFAQGPETGRPKVVWRETEVTVSSGVLTASVNLSAARVEWTTAVGAPRPGHFALAFPSVLTFDDGDGDGGYGSGESARCLGAVGGLPWALDMLNVSASAQFGATVELRLSGPVQFGGPNCPGGPSGNVSLTLLLAQRNGTVEGPSPFTLVGGLEVQVVVGLTLDGPVAGDALALELGATDLDANTSFRMRGPAGFETIAPGNGSAQREAFGPAVAGTPEPVAFVDGQGAVRGHYGWVPVSPQGLDGGQERFVQVTPTRAFSGSTMSLFLAVPLDADLSHASFLAVVGVPEPVGLPQGGTDGGVEPPAELPSFTIFVAALVAVAAMFFFSVYARAKRY
jgi:hypothetical protein